MTFVKQTLKNTASLLLAVGIIGTAYAAISTVSSGDSLTADSWNTIVNKLNNTDTNSTDLVTKSYVDSTVTASIGNVSNFPSMITPRQSTATLQNALQNCRNLTYNGYSDWRLPDFYELIHFYGDTNVTDDSTQVWAKTRNFNSNGQYHAVTRMNDFYVWNNTYVVSHSIAYYCVR